MHAIFCEMKMETTASTVGIDPTSLRFRVSVHTISPPRLPDATILPTPPGLCCLGIEPTSLAFSVLIWSVCSPLHHLVSLMSPP